MWTSQVAVPATTEFIRGLLVSGRPVRHRLTDPRLKAFRYSDEHEFPASLRLLKGVAPQFEGGVFRAIPEAPRQIGKIWIVGF